MAFGLPIIDIVAEKATTVTRKTLPTPIVSKFPRDH